MLTAHRVQIPVSHHGLHSSSWCGPVRLSSSISCRSPLPVLHVWGRGTPSSWTHTPLFSTCARTLLSSWNTALTTSLCPALSFHPLGLSSVFAPFRNGSASPGARSVPLWAQASPWTWRWKHRYTALQLPSCLALFLSIMEAPLGLTSCHLRVLVCG